MYKNFAMRLAHGCCNGRTHFFSQRMTYQPINWA